MIREVSLVAVKNGMGEFVKKCLKRQLRKWVNCDPATTAKPLHISVRVIERYALNTQRLHRSLGVPLRDRNRFKFLPVGLRKNKPARLVDKAGKSVFLV
jgi:hypothetical protein